jgi:DHA1 family multidrug resistance protein-like MFS transporter
MRHLRVLPDAAERIEAASPPPADWRRIVHAIAFSQFATKFGFAFATPFLAVFLNRELHVVDSHQLALWTGIVGGSAGLGVALASPVWGAVADRFGRKQMLIRAMIGGGFMMAATAFVQTPLQMAGGRFLLGGTAGTSSAANALVASETPRSHVGWALGLLASSTALGQAIGPLVGGLLSERLGLRWVIVFGGILILLPVIPLALYVKETKRAATRVRVTLRQALRQAGRPAALAISTLVLAQGLIQLAFVSAQQLGVVRLIGIDSQHAAMATGFTFTVLGVATGLSAFTYSRLAGRTGYRSLAIGAAILLAVAITATGLAGQLLILIVAMGVIGLVYGALSPVLATMIGMEAPGPVKATVFGVSASAGAIGQSIGPVATGSIAAVFGVPAGLAVAGSAALLVALLLAVLAREPLAL